MKFRSSDLIDESWYIKPQGIKLRYSCGGVVCRVTEAGEVLVLLTHEKDDRYYVLPKGGIEAGETDLQAATREVHEETGISDLIMLADLGRLERLSYKKNLWSNIHFFLFYTQQMNGIPTDEAHSHSPSWFAIDDEKPYFWPDQLKLIQNNISNIKELVLRYHKDIKV